MMNLINGRYLGAAKRVLTAAWQFGTDLINYGAAIFRGIGYLAASVAFPLFSLLSEKQRKRILVWSLKKLDAEAKNRGLVAETNWDSQGNIVVDVKPF